MTDLPPDAPAPIFHASYLGNTGTGQYEVWSWATNLPPATRGQVGIDTKDWASASEVYLSVALNSALDLSFLIDMLSVDDYLLLQVADDATSFGHYRLSGDPVLTEDSTNWYTIPVVCRESNGSMPGRNADVLVALWTTFGG